MPILPIILTIVIVGVLMWAINAYIPMAPKIKQLLNIVVVILLIIWLFRLFGVWDYLAGVTV